MTESKAEVKTCAWCQHEIPQTPTGKVHRLHTPDGSLIVRGSGSTPCAGSGMANPPDPDPVPAGWVKLASCGCVLGVAYLWAYQNRRAAARDLGATDGRALLVCTDEAGYEAAIEAMTIRGHHHPAIERLPHPLDD